MGYIFLFTFASVCALYALVLSSNLRTLENKIGVSVHCNSWTKMCFVKVMFLLMVLIVHAADTGAQSNSKLFLS